MVITHGQQSVPRNLWTQSTNQFNAFPVSANYLPHLLRISDSAFGELVGLGDFGL